MAYGYRAKFLESICPISDIWGQNSGGFGAVFKSQGLDIMGEFLASVPDAESWEISGGWETRGITGSVKGIGTMWGGADGVYTLVGF